MNVWLGGRSALEGNFRSRQVTGWMIFGGIMYLTSWGGSRPEDERQEAGGRVAENETARFAVWISQGGVIKCKSPWCSNGRRKNYWK